MLYWGAGEEGIEGTALQVRTTMKYQLVLQWPASSLTDYDRMIQVENTLLEGLGVEHKVAGHDEGSGETNIFIRTDSPSAAFARIRKIVDKRVMKNVRVAYREVSKSAYTVLWPRDLTEFSVV